jgi:hypothetical protein
MVIIMFSCGQLVKLFKTINDKEKLSQTTSAVGSGLANGVVSSLTRDTVQIHELVKKIMTEVRIQGVGMSMEIRNTLLSNETKKWLEETLKSLTDSEREAITELLNDPRLVSGTRRIVAGIREEMLGKVTAQEISILRDSILGPKTRQLTDSLISGAIAQLVKGSDSFMPKIDTVIEHLVKAEHRIKKDLQETIDNTKHALYGAIGLVALAVIAIILIAQRAKRHRDTIVAMAQAIDSLEDPKDFDLIAGKIHDRTSDKGVNGNLDKILEQTDLKKRKDYREYQRQAVNVLARKIKNRTEVLNDIEVDATIKEEVRKIILEKIKEN